MSLFTESVIIEARTSTGTDDYGNDTFTWTKTETPAWYEPRESGEQTNAREQVVSGYWLYLPLGTSLTSSDRVIVEGTTYQVDGEPGRQPGGFVVEGYVKAALTRVTG